MNNDQCAVCTVIKTWMQPVVPHSEHDWARYFLGQRWPEMAAALDALAEQHTCEVVR